MAALRVVIMALLCVIGVFLIIVVLLQESKSSGLSGSIAGGAETFFGKHKAKSYEGRLALLTKIAIVTLMVLSVGLVLLQKFGPEA